MKQRRSYRISEIIPYINWLYFFHAWSMNGQPKEAQTRLKEEALQRLDRWESQYQCHALFGVFDANSDGDDLLLDGIRLPLLRQQKPSHEGAPCLCLADFVRPLTSGIADKAGAFATSVDAGLENSHRSDAYERMMAQILADRLAEATAERMHLEVRKTYWGYAPDEDLPIDALLLERYQGIRPAIGYPSLPDTSANFVLDRLLDMKQIGIRLVSTGMMTPHASVSGLMLAHPEARYFDLGKIGEDQLKDYARRRGVPVEMMRRFLQSSLLKR